MKLPPEVGLNYFEFRYLTYVRGRHDPSVALSTWWSGWDKLSQLGDWLSERLPSDSGLLSQYGLRLAPCGLDANRYNWSELQISPSTHAGTDTYQVDSLFRNEDSAKVERVAESAVSLIDEVIDRIESNI